MRKQVYEIDDSGYIKEIYLSDVIDGVILDESKAHCIPLDIPNGFYKAKWNGYEWEEGKSDDEFFEDYFFETLNPSFEEEENAKFEIKLIEKLTEWGIV